MRSNTPSQPRRSATYPLLYVFMMTSTLLVYGCTSSQPQPQFTGQRFDAPVRLSVSALGSAMSVRHSIMRFRQQTEVVPVDLKSDDLIVDIARLTHHDPETCADVILNTVSVSDVDSDQLNIQCKVDGSSVPVTVVEERHRQTKYPYDVPAGLFEKEERIFAVTTRFLKVCCPRKATNHVTMSMENRLLGDNVDQVWRAAFEWSLSQ